MNSLYRGQEDPTIVFEGYKNRQLDILQMQK